MNLLPILGHMEPAHVDYKIDLGPGTAFVRVCAVCELRADLGVVEMQRISSRVAEEHHISLVPDFERLTVDAILNYGTHDGNYALNPAAVATDDRDYERAAAPDFSVISAADTVVDDRVSELLEQVEIDLLIASTDFSGIRRCPPRSNCHAAA